jgi:hypothetical protein
MTTQTKQYIELSDILALRFQCKTKGCGASLDLPINANTADSLKKCPKCRKGWTTLENTSYEGEIDNFVNTALHLKGILSALGFDLSIEIKPSV